MNRTITDRRLSLRGHGLCAIVEQHLSDETWSTQWIMVHRCGLKASVADFLFVLGELGERLTPEDFTADSPDGRPWPNVDGGPAPGNASLYWRVSKKPNTPSCEGGEH